MMVVSVEGLRLPFRGGIAPGEQRFLQWLEMAVQVKMDAKLFQGSRELEHTLDYLSLIDICQMEVKKGALLLEDLAMRIDEAIRKEHSTILGVDIHIKKWPCSSFPMNYVSIQWST